jgi:hypothetical protein
LIAFGTEERRHQLVQDAPTHERRCLTLVQQPDDYVPLRLGETGMACFRVTADNADVWHVAVSDGTALILKPVHRASVHERGWDGAGITHWTATLAGIRSVDDGGHSGPRFLSMRVAGARQIEKVDHADGRCAR